MIRSVQAGSAERWVLGLGLLVVAMLALLSSCAAVTPIERERLADPIMSYDREERLESRELHWMEAREASSGGLGGAGGGCACN